MQAALSVFYIIYYAMYDLGKINNLHQINLVIGGGYILVRVKYRYVLVYLAKAYVFYLFNILSCRANTENASRPRAINQDSKTGSLP